jgi:membrane protein
VLARLFRVPVGWGEILRRTAVEIYEDNCLGLAAALAYYFFLALFPAMLALVALASFFPLERLVPRLIESAGPLMPPDVLAIVSEQLEKIGQGNHGGLLTFGFLAALWSSSAAVMAITDALNRAYDVEEARPWWRTRITAILLTVALALFILVSFALVLLGPTLAERLAGYVGAGPAAAWVWSALRWPIVFAIIASAVGLVYYFAPDVEQEWVWLTPGSLVATVMWILASLGFRYYIVNFGNYTETYGAIGGVIVLLLWLYISGLAILAGAELNAEIEHTSSAGKDPGEKAPGQLARVPGALPGGNGTGAGGGGRPLDAPPWPWIAAGAMALAGLLLGRAVRGSGMRARGRDLADAFRIIRGRPWST